MRHVTSLPHSEVPRFSLPSWVPDLRRIGDYDPLASYTIRAQRFFAGGRAGSAVRVSSDGKVLECRRLIVDRVESLVLSVPETKPTNEEEPSFDRNHKRIANLPIGVRSQSLGQWLCRCYDLAATLINAEPHRHEIRTAFYRTMLCVRVAG